MLKIIKQKAILSLLLCIAINQIIFAEKISIKGIDIRYDESNKKIITSGNAQLIHPTFTVFAESIIYNQNTNIITGHKNVELIQNNQILLSDNFTFNTSSNQLDINNLSIEFSTNKKNQQIYINAIEFSDSPSKKVGKSAHITTCNNYPSHYHLTAETFIIYPEKRLIGQNVKLVNPIYFIPFGFWSPAYILELGKRKVIYLMPVIGSNRIEGGFIKNQFDYVINDTWTGQAYVDYISKKGLGFGTNLSYDNYSNLSGSIYYYAVVDSQYNIKSWDQSYQLTPENKLTTKIKATDMYLIQGNYSKTDHHSIEFENTTDDASQKTKYTFNQSNSSSIRPQNYELTYNKRTHDSNSLNINLKQTKSSTLSESYSISNQHKIGYDINSNNNISISRKEISATDSRKDSFLRTKNYLDKKLSFGTVKTGIDYYFDLDDDTVTRDIKNHIIQKTPELDLTLNTWNLNDNWSIHETFQYGYYTEYYYINSLDTQRIWRESRMTFNQNIVGEYRYNFLDSVLRSKTNYTQFYYTSGDQNYTLSNMLSYKTDSFSFLQTSTEHNQVWVAENGNTPFYFDEKSQIEKNELKETIKLYLISPTKYFISFASGYNWISNSQLNNNMELNIKPNKHFKLNVKTTYLNTLKKYTPLVSRIDFQQSKQLATSIKANYDLNDGELINLNHLLTGSIGSSWESRWTFKAYFTYAPKYDQNYQLETLSLEKDLHCRTLSLMYNRILEEYRFQFTINAFPDSKIGGKTNKYESFLLEGLFDDQSIQR